MDWKRPFSVLIPESSYGKEGRVREIQMMETLYVKFKRNSKTFIRVICMIFWIKKPWKQKAYYDNPCWLAGTEESAVSNGRSVSLRCNILETIYS